MSTGMILTRGLWKENPVFKLLLGMCPVLAVTTSGVNGMGMGLASAAVLVCAEVVVSCMRNIIPSKVRIPAFIVIIATFVTVVDLCMAAFLPGLHKSLGLFIPLIVVNCLILGRSEAWASKNGMFTSALDGISMGLGFTLGLTVLGLVRELLGSGQLFGMTIFSDAWYPPFILMILPPGAFIALGCLLALMNVVENKKA